VPTPGQLAEMGYKLAIDAVASLLVSFHFAKQAYSELAGTGAYQGMSAAEFVAARKEIEDLVGLEEFYRIEEATVEKRRRRAP
jgi:2-methylisocitrate lyase-like PEP mutase family enzyme